MRRRTLVVLLAAALGGAAWADHTNNIMLTGFWPPTNNMLRQFSTNPAQNPGGWAGGNWEGRGYNVYSYFPEFSTIPPTNGSGDFEVDYQDTSSDFWRLTAELKPAAIITFGLADLNDRDWELEGGHTMYAINMWDPDYVTPTRPSPASPIGSQTPGTFRASSLPMDSIVSDLLGSGVNVTPYSTTGDTSKFLCNFIGYHACWYHDMHSAASDPAQCFAAGHIHVGGLVSDLEGQLATEVTLRSLTAYLDTLVPEPTSAALLLVVFALARGRR
jgi:hypothetical protein